MRVCFTDAKVCLGIDVTDEQRERIVDVANEWGAKERETMESWLSEGLQALAGSAVGRAVEDIKATMTVQQTMWTGV